MPDSPPIEAPGTLCVGCGICCDGTLFTTAEITEAEKGPLAEAGASIALRGEKSVLSLPCAAFSGECCAIYERRPAICRAYRCKLLRGVEAGEIALNAAKNTVADAKAWRDRVRPALESFVSAPPNSSFYRLYELMHARFDADPDPSAARRAHVDLVLEVAALRVLLVSKFELERKEEKEGKDGVSEPCGGEIGG